MSLSASLALFRFAAKAALNCVGFGVAGDFFAELLPDVAIDVYQRWAKKKAAHRLRADLEAIARTSDEQAQRAASQVAAEVVPAGAPELRLALASWLSQVPALVRQTQRRPADPTGHTSLPGFSLSRPADLLGLLPPRLPRFQKGQRAPGFPDWELAELLGIGGFGEVWKAVNPHLPPVALKFCLDAATARVLRNEAELLGRVARQGRHPGIVTLLDTALSSDPPCLKYEYVPGGDLAGLIREWHSGPREKLPERALNLLRQLAEIVKFAHGLRPPIVHRDLKPANVLVQVPEDGPERVKVADFGIGSVVAAWGTGTLATLSRGGWLPTALRGSCTPLYASPQQMRGDDPDPRDDVFALGVLWYQMLAGELTEPPGADWREELAGLLPTRALDLLGRCLAVRAERRFENAGTLARELAGLDEPQKAPARRAGLILPAPAAPIPLDPPPEMAEEEEWGSDDPADLAGQVKRSLERAQAALAEATRLAEEMQDYAGAVRLLEKVPGPYADNGLLDIYRSRRDRVAQLRREVADDAQAGRFAGLRDRIEELLELTPSDEEMRRLSSVVPWQPGAELVNSLGMKLVLVPAGRFLMGSRQAETGRAAAEGPLHEVRIARRFYLGAFLVTQEQYRRVTGSNPAHFQSVAGCDCREFPVENVTWDEAVSFCAKLSAMPQEQERGRVYRLPTEAEWEYACRAGVEGPFSPGSSLTSAQANFDGRHPYAASGKGEFLLRTTAVGSYRPNAWGLFDMHGNLWEWCADWFGGRYYRNSPKEDPAGPESGEARVLRGGSWQNHGKLCRSACRDSVRPGFKSFTIGFRVALSVAAEPPAEAGAGKKTPARRVSRG